MHGWKETFLMKNLLELIKYPKKGDLVYYAPYGNKYLYEVILVTERHFPNNWKSPEITVLIKMPDAHEFSWTPTLEEFRKDWRLF